MKKVLGTVQVRRQIGRWEKRKEERSHGKLEDPVAQLTKSIQTINPGDLDLILARDHFPILPHLFHPVISLLSFLIKCKKKLKKYT